MEPAELILDESTARKLSAANGGPVRLRNPAGEVLGYYFSAAQMGRQQAGWQAAPAGRWTDEEIARLAEERKNDPRPNIPHDEVLRWVEGQ